ncbi:MAG: hypothetical protein ACRER5_22980, partial [Pseudomonas sp.]
MEKVTQALEADPDLRLLSKSKLTATLKPQGITTADVTAYFASNSPNERFARPSTKFRKPKITA